MIIFGTKAVSRRQDSGVFFCPRCGGDRHYDHKAARRWFTLYFIPVIPLNGLGDFVECRHCNSTFYPAVLTNKTAGEMEDVATIAVRHVVVSMLTADGQVLPVERDAALKVMSRFATRPYGAADLTDDLRDLQVTDLTDKLEELGAILSAEGKESVLSAATYLAACDGSVDAEELATANQIGKALTMSDAHISGTINQELSRLGISTVH